MNTRTERAQETITLWNDESGIGLRFKEGESLQGHLCQIILAKVDNADQKQSVEEISRISQLLTEEAAALYPMEFAPLQTPQ